MRKAKRGTAAALAAIVLLVCICAGFAGAETAPDSVFCSFEAKDLNGNPVNQDVFRDYDLTMINIWATWCGPCVRELPELEALYRRLPENVNMITLCADASGAGDMAGMILESVGATFTTVAGEPEMEETLLKDVLYYPTTYFVNREGRIIGAPVETAQTAEEYEADIRQRLWMPGV